MTTITAPRRQRGQAPAAGHATLPCSWLAKIVIAVLIVTGVLAAGDQPTIGALERSFPAHVQPAEDRAQLRTDGRHRYEHLHCLRAAYRLSLDPAQCPWVR